MRKVLSSSFVRYVVFVVLFLACIFASIACRGVGPVEQPIGPEGKGEASRSATFADGDFVYRQSSKIPTNSPNGFEMSSWADASGSVDAGASVQDAGPPAPTPGAPSGRTDKVEEGDLYKVVDHTLFYLSTYKGLSIFSLADPKAPKKISNLPVYGTPIEMFFEGKRAYVLVKDALFLSSVNGAFRFRSRRVSQLVVVDLSVPHQPRLLKRFDIRGRLREGLSRKIGSILYAVSFIPKSYYSNQERESAKVYSFDLSDINNVREVQNIELIDPNRKPSDAKKDEKYQFHGITISATSNSLLVSERWSYTSYRDDDACYGYRYYQKTVLNLIDISNPKGAIRVHTRLTTRGWVTDQFKQTYAYDPVAKKGIYYGIFQQNEWVENGCDRWNWRESRIIRNRLVSLDISNGEKPILLGSLVFGKPNETVRGSLFDHKRKVVYAITAVETDPLYAISFADPRKLKVLSAIDGLSGDINVFRLIEGGQFLMGIGRDNSSHCSGFQGSGDWSPTKVAVSLFDVRDLNKVKLVQRRCVAVNARWSSSQVNRNRDQAHKMIGMLSDATLNAVSVPVSYYAARNSSRWWWYGYETAIGLMSWDVKRYDPKKDETQQRVLEQMGSVIHPWGQVKRTILLHMTHNGQKRRYALNLSDTYLSLADLQDPKKPVMLSSLPLHPYVYGAYSFGKYMLVHSGSQDRQGIHQFQVKRVGAGPVDQWAVSNTLTMGAVTRVHRSKNLLLIYRRKLDVKASQSSGYARFERQPELLIYDYANPASPVLRKTLKLQTDELYHKSNTRLQGAREGARLSYSSYGRAMFLDTAHGPLTFRSDYTSRESTWVLNWLDLQTPEKASNKSLEMWSIKHTTSYDQRPKAYGLVRSEGDDDVVYLLKQEFVRKSESNGWRHVYTRFYAQTLRWQNGNWTLGAKINVPGRVLFAYREQGHTHFVSLDDQQFSFDNGNKFRSYPRLTWLKVVGGKARILATKTFTKWTPTSALFHDNRLYLTAFENKASIKKQHLWVMEARGRAFATSYREDTALTSLRLLGVKRDTLLFEVGYAAGLLIGDIQNPFQPKPTHYTPLESWQKLLVTNNGLYSIAGYFGVRRVDVPTFQMK